MNDHAIPLSLSLSVSPTDIATVHEILARQLDVKPHQLTMDASFTHDLSADSLDAVQITMDLEEQFNIVLPDDAWDSIQTVGDLFEALAPLLGAQRSAGRARG